MNRHLTLRKSALVRLAAVALTIGSAHNAMANLVLNGGFESTTNGPNAFLPSLTMPTDWSYAGGVAAIYSAGAADTIGANQGGAQIYLWGPGNPTSPPPNSNSLNGLPATSPDGGNYLASDSDPPFSGAIYQTINALIPGNKYALTFWYAAAQFRSPDGTFWNGATHSLWRVSLGAAGSYDTPDLPIAEHGFSVWMNETHTFTVPLASTGAEVLRFLAVGGPGGLPPVALLDGVSLVAVPEPETILLIAIGIVGIAAACSQKKKHV